MGGGGEGSGGGAGTASLRETRDFSNVASFSELPFLRSAPARESTNFSGIRIFGIDVPRSSPEGKAKETTATVADTTAAATQSSSGSGSAIAAAPDSSRKFECHYCCRHFPTSQALGGHQNAHKRERQHAKRVQMQTTMAAAAAAAAGGVHHHHHLLGYPQHRYGMAGSTVATLYPSWPTAGGPGGGGGAMGPQFYSGIGSIAQPITGNPLTTAGLWRGMPAGHGNMSIPPGAERRRPLVLSEFRGDEPASASLRAPPSSLLLSPQGQFVCEQPATTASEGVSLDLHL